MSSCLLKIKPLFANQSIKVKPISKFIDQHKLLSQTTFNIVRNKCDAKMPTEKRLANKVAIVTASTDG